MTAKACVLLLVASVAATLPAAAAPAAATSSDSLALDIHSTVRQISLASVETGLCPLRPVSRVGYHTALADSLQDLQDLTAVLHASGWLVSTHAVGRAGSCWALIYCDPDKVDSACPAKAP